MKISNLKIFFATIGLTATVLTGCGHDNQTVTPSIEVEQVVTDEENKREKYYDIGDLYVVTAKTLTGETQKYLARQSSDGTCYEILTSGTIFNIEEAVHISQYDAISATDLKAKYTKEEVMNLYAQILEIEYQPIEQEENEEIVSYSSDRLYIYKKDDELYLCQPKLPFSALLLLGGSYHGHDFFTNEDYGKISNICDDISPICEFIPLNERKKRYTRDELIQIYAKARTEYHATNEKEENQNIIEETVESELEKIDEVEKKENIVVDTIDYCDEISKILFGKNYDYDMIQNLIYISYEDGEKIHAELNQLSVQEIDEIVVTQLVPKLHNLKTLSLTCSLKNEDNLEIFKLPNNYIQDLVQNNPELSNLGLLNCELMDSQNLKQLSNLEQLFLFNNNLSDITLISQLTNLKTLTIIGNSVNDISPVSELSNLELLDLSNNQIDNIETLSTLYNLESLHLNGNKITDASPLVELENLKHVGLGNNPLEYMPVLENASSIYVDEGVEFKSGYQKIN